MAKTLSYSDAARLLGGQDSAIVAALDMVTGGLLLATAPLVPAAVLGLFDAKAEAVRLGHKLVRSVAEQTSGLSRHGRTERISAAHSILVVTAYFEALDHADLPFRFADLAFSRTEQESLAASAGEAARTTLGLPVPLPMAHEPDEDFHERLMDYYLLLSEAVRKFVQGLDAYDRLTETAQNWTGEVFAELPQAAVVRYAELSRQLAGDFPEVATWSARRDHAATRAEIRMLGTTLSEVHSILAKISTGRAPDERRAGLAVAYRSELTRPLIDAADTPAGLTIPTLAEAYVEPLFRVAEIEPGTPSNEERWWSRREIRDDLEDFITGHLTSPQATVAPLLVLGQPGSGKSVLTKILSARLPAADFMPVRVVLREAPADAEPQEQIEHAVWAATGERLEWPALVKTAGDALPVVLLDGFDELLQATGVSQTDYLIKIARLQQREADQGRPLAVLVTSRTSVADRARPPEGAVAMRLEPFDVARVGAWLGTWNDANAGHFAAQGLARLEPEMVLRHRDLAGQPLLLLMCALYDADSNALQNLAKDLGQGELYDRLLRDFAVRELRKGDHEPDERAIREELDRLSVVGLAMFNRGAQWITEADLRDDLTALSGTPSLTPHRGRRAPLGAAERMLGKFFFIHRSQATRDGAELRTYEFLHATFGEFLVARLVWSALREVAALEAVSASGFGSAPVSDDRLHALISFCPLSSRAPILGFLGELAGALPAAERNALAGQMIRLFRMAHEERPPRANADYRPRRLPVTVRQAAYSANLMLLAICLGGAVTGRDLFGEGRDRVADWHREALLWRSQLSSEDWSSIGYMVRLHRIRGDDGRRDIRLELTNKHIAPPPVDPAWTYEIGGVEDREDVYLQHSANTLTRKGYLLCGHLDDVMLHALEPVLGSFPQSTGAFHQLDAGGYTSAAHSLLRVWTLPVTDADVTDRRRAYLYCTRAAADQGSHYARLLLDRLATDSDADAELVADVISTLFHSKISLGDDETRVAVARCALPRLELTRGLDVIDGRLKDAIHIFFTFPTTRDSLGIALAWTRFAELGLYTTGSDEEAWPEWPGWPAWPDLTARFRHALRSAEGNPGVPSMDGVP